MLVINEISLSSAQPDAGLKKRNRFGPPSATLREHGLKRPTRLYGSAVLVVTKHFLGFVRPTCVSFTYTHYFSNPIPLGSYCGLLNSRIQIFKR